MLNSRESWTSPSLPVGVVLFGLVAGACNPEVDHTSSAEEASRNQQATPESPPDSAREPTELGLPFEIVEVERLKKGGSLNPTEAPPYVLLRVNAALVSDSSELAEETVKETLRAGLRKVRESARGRDENIDGVSLFLYASQDHMTASTPLGRAEWWPKGHSFGPENAANIKDKSTYVESIDVLALPKSSGVEVERLPEDVRREIFAELVLSQDRATQEAEEAHPLNASNIPADELRSYDFRTAMGRNSELEKELLRKYESDICARFEITPEELQLIRQEGREEQWPLPPQ